MDLILRPAVPEDVEALVALRARLFTDLARQGSATLPDQVEAAGWQKPAARLMRQQLTHPDHHYTVAHADSDAGPPRILAWGHAILIHQIPGPGFPTGLMGQISSLVVGADDRGNGIGTAVSTALIEWLTQAGAEVIDLLASGQSETMFRHLGFIEPSSTSLRYLTSNIATDRA